MSEQQYSAAQVEKWPEEATHIGVNNALFYKRGEGGDDAPAKYWGAAELGPHWIPSFTDNGELSTKRFEARPTLAEEAEATKPPPSFKRRRRVLDNFGAAALPAASEEPSVAQTTIPVLPLNDGDVFTILGIEYTVTAAQVSASRQNYGEEIYTFEIKARRGGGQ